MSQPPLDQHAADTATEQANSAQAPEATSAAPARRHHRRAPSRRAGTPKEQAAQHPEAAPVEAAPVEPAAQAATPVAPVAAAAESAPAPARGTARTATGTRRRSPRSRTPQLVTPPRTEELAPVVEESGVAAGEAAPGAVAGPSVEAGEAASAEGVAFEAQIETVTPAEVAQAVDTATQPRPRRYRFDRPASAAGAAPAPAIRAERLAPAPPAPVPAAAAPEATPARGPEMENLLSLLAPSAPSALVTVPPVPSTETPAPEALEAAEGREIAPAQANGAHAEGAEGAAEPAYAEEAGLEESEAAGGAEGEAGQATRRRRRRRRTGTSAVRHLEAVVPAEQEAEPTPIPARPGARAAEPLPTEEPFPAYGNRHDIYPPFEEQPGGPAPYAPGQREGWHVANAYQQMQEPRSPFGAPEPYAPRGFGAQPQGTAAPFQERPFRTARTERPTDVPPMSANQLGTVITHAIQQQTDRLLTELRHTQAPPSMTVMFPPLPSTERVGLFVDVANLLYSSRNMRVSIDFGRLLEFLRGNRRLVRAHAYAPTSPEPHAEQQFLSVVKGVGYRITTKNYKTFSNGAKKADLDLDMCMDIVRMVDARAIDTVVLVSGDSDFLPLLEYCSDHGVRVEVAAFDDAAAMILRQSCDLFVNLSLVDDIRA